MIDQLINLATNTTNFVFTTIIETIDFGFQIIRNTPDLINQSIGSYRVGSRNLRGSGFSGQILRTGQMLWGKYDNFIWNLKDEFQEQRQYKLPGKPYQPLPELDINLKTLSSLQ
tara:strand:+ start:7320 stop:7661 length:342 start_codon:yes stop_codon:yes gene_type:complete